MITISMIMATSEPDTRGALAWTRRCHRASGPAGGASPGPGRGAATWEQWNYSRY